MEAGGNFIDTANVYSRGQSETMLGDFLSESSSRDRVVLATKFSITTRPGDPNASGNGRKNIYQSIDASLRRLKTDYIDLYWVHYWDTLTPAEEVIDTLDSLVRSGKVRYIGLSDVPSWYMARAQTYAEAHGKTRLAAMQLEYSLLDRFIENEHIVAGHELGVGVCVWGPLGSGLLTGKYRKAEGGKGIAGEGRIATDPRYGRQISDRNFGIVEALVGVAEQIGRSPSQVALNWIAHRPGVSATIIGATSQRQLDENLAALDFDIPAALSDKLEEVSRGEPIHLYDFFREPSRSALRGAVVSR
jgi:aryl-alcohol dehydrogenase-like predicted oxidoreductase